RVGTLAATIRTEKADDSLATDFSLLQVTQTMEEMEYSRWPYIILWPLMMCCALWVVPKVWIFRLYWYLFHRPKFKRSDIRASADDSVAEQVEKERRRERLNEYNLRWLLGPRHALWLFDSHWLGERVRYGVLTSQALDGINAVPVLRQLDQLNTIRGRLVRFWLNQPDGQAVRNRLRITYKELLTELCRLWTANKRQIRVLSLACGSAQATIEALARFLEFKPEARGMVELHLVDLSGSSLLRAIHLAKERGVESYVHIHVKDVKTFVRGELNDLWDIVEMVGFLDYRPWKSAVEICREIRRILRPNGLFVSAHIGPSAWSFAVRWAINWSLLIRRTVGAYRRILFEAGFIHCEIEMRVEPHRIHPVGVCRKIRNF
ncbi:MAG: class I SAM-dependent methyltransferase, partial [Patescibacteria group bacterium]